MLLKQYSYDVEIVDRGAILTVTRIADQQTKQYFLAGHTTRNALDAFMENITDDLVSSYFPKPNKPHKTNKG